MNMDPKLVRYYGRISGAVMLKVFLVFLGYSAGNTLDIHFHTYPWLMMLGIILGAGLGIWWIVRIADKSEADTN